AAAVLLAGLLRRAGARGAWLGALAFSFVPAVYVASTAGMDYLWACALILLGFSWALERRSVPAGVVLGLATACRITSIAHLWPLAVGGAAPEHRGRARAIAALAVPALAVGSAAYLPVFLRYGGSFLSYYEPAGGHMRSGGHFLAGLATLYRLPLPP